MKNLTLILAFIIGTSFALTAQRGSSNSNSGSNNSNYNNSSQLNRNPNMGQTDRGRGSDYTNSNRRHNYSGNQYNNHHNNHHNGHHGQHNGNNHNHQYGHNHHNHHNNHHNHQSYHGNSYGYGHYTNYHPGWHSVCVADFNRGCRSIRHYGFDNDRLCAAKRFASSRHLSVNQVREIMHMFTFESTKLKFAKFAFSRTCDVQNYYLVFDCLTFNSSRRELDCFINNQFY